MGKVCNSNQIRKIPPDSGHVSFNNQTFMAENSIQNKFHWYDGRFYDKVIAPNQKELFSQIIGLIKPKAKIIDVGCGTGFFSFSVAEKCTSVLGIDLSNKNIDRANRNLNRKSSAKLKFRHSTIEELVSENEHFDYAVMTYVIHEVNENERIPLLLEMSKVADKIIIGDYLVPQPRSFSGKLTAMVEYIAGTEHYTNFRNYERNGGIHYLAEKAGLSIETEIRNNTNHIVVLTK